MKYFEHRHKTQWQTELPETGLGSFPVSLMPTQACQGISSPTWALPKAPNQEAAEQTEGQRQDKPGSHANSSKSIINSWFHHTVWLGEVLRESWMKEEEMPSQVIFWAMILIFLSIIYLYSGWYFTPMQKTAHAMINNHLKSYLEPRQVLNKYMKNHWHVAFIMQVFSYFRTPLSLIKPQLQMPVGSLVKTS